MPNRASLAREQNATTADLQRMTCVCHCTRPGYEGRRDSSLRRNWWQARSAETRERTLANFAPELRNKMIVQDPKKNASCGLR